MIFKSHNGPEKSECIIASMSQRSYSEVMGDLTRAVWQDSNMSLSKASPSSAVLLKLSITSESCVYKYSPLKPPQQSKCVL